MPIYSIRYTTSHPTTGRPQTDSFIKSARNYEEALELAKPHLRYLQDRTAEALNIKDIVEIS